MTTPADILKTPRPQPVEVRTRRLYTNEDGTEAAEDATEEFEVWAGWKPEDGTPVLIKVGNPDDQKTHVWLIRSTKLSPTGKRIGIVGEKGSYTTPSNRSWGNSAEPTSANWFQHAVDGTSARGFRMIAFPWEVAKVGDDPIISDEDYATRQANANSRYKAAEQAELAKGFTVRLAERLAGKAGRFRTLGCANEILRDYPDGITAEDTRFLAKLFDDSQEDIAAIKGQLADARRALDEDRHFIRTDRVKLRIAGVLPDEAFKEALSE